MKPRVVLFGLDAADSSLIRQWAAEGCLPTIAALMAEGAQAALTTPVAVLEGGIWPTFLTSTSPATHGMFSYEGLRPGTYDIELPMMADRLRIPPFWMHASQAGRRVAVVDAPFARPAPRLNGLQLTNWGAHDGWCWPRTSAPASLAADLVARFGEHPVPACDAPGRSLADYADLRARLLDGVARRTALLRHLLALEAWDLFVGVYSESHCAGHQMWHLMDPTHPRHEPTAARELHTAIRDVYAAIDAGLGTLIAGLPADTHVMVMASHGMGPYYAGSHMLHLVLERLDIAGPAGQPSAANGPRETEDGNGHDAGESSAARRLLWGARRLVPTGMRQAIRARLPREARSLWRWAHGVQSVYASRRAFTLPTNNMTGAIRINLKGREPAGLVAPGREYDTLCDGLAERMLALVNAETGRPAVRWVRRAGELYRGPRLGELPDLFVEWDHDAPITTLTSPHIGTLTLPYRGDRTGDHRAGGLLLARGPGIRQGEVKDEVVTQDVAPTVLDLLGVARPATLEGASRLATVRVT